MPHLVRPDERGGIWRRTQNGGVMTRKHDMWAVSIELWKSGAVVSSFLREEIFGLRDAQGDPLPESVKNFLDDLIFCRVKPRKGRPRSKSAIIQAYKTRVILEKLGNQTIVDQTPSERAIASIAADLNMSDSAISQIVHPRKSRQS